MRLVIRDDDTNYFTQPEDLERWYSKIWNKVPIHLAVIPYVYAGQAEVPLEKRDGLYHWFWTNKRLCNFLKRKIKEGKIVIWQHGITHQDMDGQFECEQSLTDYSYTLYQYCKDRLEEELKTKIDIFVAPHDRFSREVIDIIENLKMNICRCFAPLFREFRFNKYYIRNIWELFKLYIQYGTKYRPIYWMEYGKHKELYSYRIDQITYENIDDILKRHKNGTLCITVHNRTMDQFSLEKLNYIIKRMN